MTFLSWLHDTAFAVWVREADTVWAYPTVLFLHSLGMAILVGLNAALDLRVLGVGKRIPLAPLERLFPLMWGGFLINALSGTALFMADAVQKAANPVFYIKLLLIVLSVVNMRLLKAKVFGPGADTRPLPVNAKLLATTSLLLWMGAITAGRLMAYLGNSR